jgi:hypothetical protein
MLLGVTPLEKLPKAACTARVDNLMRSLGRPVAVLEISVLGMALRAGAQSP